MREGVVEELDLTTVGSEEDNCLDKEASGACIEST